MQTLNRGMAGIAAVACVFALGPSAADAQQPETPAAQCTAQLRPAQVQAGQAAVELTVVLSEQVGEVTGLEAPESGITVASPDDLPRTELAAEERPAPIEMGEQGANSWIIWVSTEEASAGTYDVAFTGSQGRCQAQITVR